MLKTAMAERIAFTPCEICNDLIQPRTGAERESSIRGITPRRNKLLSTIRLMLTQYDLLIPLEDMITGLKVMEHKWPTIFANISTLESHARSNAKEKTEKIASDDEIIAQRGGFLLTYEAAIAKFCTETNHIGVQTDFCNDVMEVSERYLLWTDANIAVLLNKVCTTKKNCTRARCLSA